MSDRSHRSVIEEVPDVEVDLDADIEKQPTTEEDEVERIKENYRPKSLALPPPPGLPCTSLTQAHEYSYSTSNVL